MSASSIAVMNKAELIFDWFVDLDQYLAPEGNAHGVRNEFQGVVGSSRALRGVLDQVRIVAPTDSTVLIEGETGIGDRVCGW